MTLPDNRKGAHPIIIIAHRGNGPTSHISGQGGVVPSQLAPENTLKAFRKAIKEGADGIELDIYMSKDGIPMVIHDDELNINVEGANRRTRELGMVSQKSARELAGYNVGQGEKIPTLQEVLELVGTENENRRRNGLTNLIINIELKGKNTGLAALRAVQDATTKGYIKNEDVAYCSFNFEELLRVKEHNGLARIAPCIKTKTLFGDAMQMPGWKVKAGTPCSTQSLDELQKISYGLYQPMGFDLVLWDLRPSIIKLAQRNLMSCLFISTSNFRQPVGPSHLLCFLALISVSRHTKVYFKTDEPEKMRAFISYSSKALELIRIVILKVNNCFYDAISCRDLYYIKNAGADICKSSFREFRMHSAQHFKALNESSLEMKRMLMSTITYLLGYYCESLIRAFQHSTATVPPFKRWEFPNDGPGIFLNALAIQLEKPSSPSSLPDPDWVTCVSVPSKGRKEEAGQTSMLGT